MKFRLYLLLPLFLPVLVSAQSDTSTFAIGLENWSPGFADYPAGEETFYRLAAAHARLPAPLDSTAHALMISGSNHSDDLFMYMKKRITGLLPHTVYRVRFDVEFASNASTTSFGIGGAPGGAVTVKCGASAREPMGVLDEAGYYRMNIDKGNQVQRGADMDTIGNVGVTDTTTVYALTTRSNATHLFTVTTDGTGGAWVIIGTDSGFEGITTLYYNRIVVTFSDPTPLTIDVPSTPETARLLPSWPSPMRTHGNVPVRLERPASIDLDVYDAAGRRVATILAGTSLPAGTHVIPLPVSTLPRGLLLLHLRAGGSRSVTKMLVNR
ncbi:MAG: hypothetical protein RRA94_10035 [Bacteroidota bacterium]|nr:hypothetical protein [Bacteroidota bacterium]